MLFWIDMGAGVSKISVFVVGSIIYSYVFRISDNQII